MKKNMFFLILCFSLFLMKSIIVNAETILFYEGEYIDGIYMSKYQYSTKTTYYQKARFFRKEGSHEFAYCIEPFEFFKDNSLYDSTITPGNLTSEQLKRISLIAHFGYGYHDHQDTKWYAITQMMIWQAADPYSGDYYFTDGLNGRRIDAYTNEMNEINQLIQNYLTLPSFHQQEFTVVEDHSLTIKDQNQIVYSYLEDEENAYIQGNTLVIKPLKEGKYTFSIYRKETIYNHPYIFYQSQNSQNLIQTGDIEAMEARISVKVVKTELNLTKIDQETKSIEPQGEASLDGAIYEIENEKGEKQQLEIKNNIAQMQNLDFGKYTIKEKEPGKGYLLDDKVYEIEITPEHTKIDLILENKVIKKEITIHKEYGENDDFKGEENISFQVFNHKQELIDTLLTNEEGKTTITLPYGKYHFIQLNSSKGYEKLDPFEIMVEDEEKEEIQLRDLKIPVPNTHTDGLSKILMTIILISLFIIC